jgi:hypothetical protein
LKVKGLKKHTFIPHTCLKALEHMLSNKGTWSNFVGVREVYQKKAGSKPKKKKEATYMTSAA